MERKHSKDKIAGPPDLRQRSALLPGKPLTVVSVARSLCYGNPKTDLAYAHNAPKGCHGPSPRRLHAVVLHQSQLDDRVRFPS